MLIRFRVENHRSLRDEQVLSLVASRSEGPDDACLLRPPALSEPLLPSVALYGANASGKTNVLLALAFMHDVVIESHRLWEPDGGVPREPFALSKHHLAPSLYEVEVLVEGVRYRYGFVLSNERVEEEWLYAWPGRRRQLRFERQGGDYEFSRSLGSQAEVIRALTRPNSLFVSAAAQNNYAALLPVFRWFQRLVFDLQRSCHAPGEPSQLALRVLRQWGDRSASRFASEPSVGPVVQPRDLTDLLDLLRAADTGIVELRIKSEPDADGVTRPALRFRHQAQDAEYGWLPFEVESSGTRTLVGLAANCISLLRLGGVLCIDELESSLHPMLASALIRLFATPARNPHGAQLIFTTHDTNLLGTTLGGTVLRRDQVWLTEKDASGATHLYPLTDFHPRKHENMERGYLQGRYGAVPFLRELLAAPDGVEPA